MYKKRTSSIDETKSIKSSTPSTPYPMGLAAFVTEKLPQEFSNNDRELLIYTPHNKSDPSAGRSKWCGLCERAGHDSIDCPYENEMF
ncbi:unnamed protein product [[Candida] boidinii]|uniref:Unnamed protein product n=1 Tax=Candida boidinii TaxID=5477 RepID=A0ACB5TR58_CANBO|nr:unnamed protein product [[Candida] boidinii]GME92236.1 unnamed protein product [[Candida] boidinii]GMF05553.1 unnamed protein product [[Candida] boidinii]